MSDTIEYNNNCYEANIDPGQYNGSWTTTTIDNKYYRTWNTDKNDWNKLYTFEGGQYIPDKWDDKYYPTDQGGTAIPNSPTYPFDPPVLPTFPNVETNNKLSEKISNLEKALKEDKEELDKLTKKCNKLVNRNKKIEKENKELKERNEKLNKYNKFEIMDI